MRSPTIPTISLPKTMTAAQGRDYGDIDEMLSVRDDASVPSLASLPPAQRKTKMLIQVLAVALAPGDCRVLSGKTRKFQGPPSFPYVVGGDCCGVVLELPDVSTDDKTSSNEDLPFTVGDRVAVRFDEKPYGACGEYAIVSTKIAAKVPDRVSSVAAAALASASPATLLADRIQPGERVLVLGAGGGVGSHLCQLLRQRGASFVAGTSRSPARLLQAPLSCDAAVDYTKEDVWTKPEWIRQPFDVIVDLAAGGWLQLRGSRRHALIVKSCAAGGRYITTTPDSPTFALSSIWGLLRVFLFPALWRAALSRTWYRRQLPAYSYALALPQDNPVMLRTMALADDTPTALQAVVDPAGPFALTTEGVRRAFRLLESRHSQGKVVIQIADDPPKKN
jgi:NADPH:quinone reductase-like Zn-dependent oxidoreductase